MITTINFDSLYLAGPVKVQAIAADSQSPAPLIAYSRPFGVMPFRDVQCMVPLTDEDVVEARSAGRVIMRITLADDRDEQFNRLAFSLVSMRGQG